jgi:hypothetical protein
MIPIKLCSPNLVVVSHFRGEHDKHNAVAFGIYMIVQRMTWINGFLLLILESCDGLIYIDIVFKS